MSKKVTNTTPPTMFGDITLDLFNERIKKELDTIPHYHEIRPKSHYKRFLQYIRLKPRVYRPYAKKGYRLEKDVWGVSYIQVPKNTPKRDKNMKIVFNRHTPLVKKEDK